MVFADVVWGTCLFGQYTSILQLNEITSIRYVIIAQPCECTDLFVSTKGLWVDGIASYWHVPSLYLRWSFFAFIGSSQWWLLLYHLRFLTVIGLSLSPLALHCKGFFFLLGICYLLNVKFISHVAECSLYDLVMSRSAVRTTAARNGSNQSDV